MSEWSYVIAAYALTWLVVLGYVFGLARRLRRAQEDLSAVAATNGAENSHD